MLNEITETLIIFSRYPEPGKTKTRMIPALGADGAANLQRRLSEHTLKQARKIGQLREIDLAVYFAGGNVTLMKNWLGDDVRYREQAEGDLGSKMRSAFADNLSERRKVVIIGIDCPGIDRDILNSAFTTLESNDLVLGEAVDGGYYLIGLSKLVVELFVDIEWGTAEVFSKTKAIAEKLHLKIAYLPILRDMDRPDDLDLLNLIN